MGVQGSSCKDRSTIRAVLNCLNLRSCREGTFTFDTTELYFSEVTLPQTDVLGACLRVEASPRRLDVLC